MSSEVILSDLREALARLEDWGDSESGLSEQVVEDIGTGLAAAREYEPLVEAVMMFATETGKRVNDLMLQWIEDQ